MSPSPAERVYLGLGANLGAPLDQLREAVRRLGERVDVERVSSVYRTEPIGYAEQPDFYNLVVSGVTRLEPRALLAEALRIEAELGRERSFRDAPRTLDIDLLDQGSRLLDTPELTLPHPRLHERAFVLVPLAEIAPDWVHPRLLVGAAGLLQSLAGGARVERHGPLTPRG